MCTEVIYTSPEVSEVLVDTVKLFKRYVPEFLIVLDDAYIGSDISDDQCLCCINIYETLRYAPAITKLEYNPSADVWEVEKI